MADRPLAGRIAFVTGSGRGLGRAMADKLAALGADVAIHDRDASQPAKYGEVSGFFGGRGRLAQAAAGALLISTITDGLGRLDVSAGITVLVAGGVLIIAAWIDALSRRRPGATALLR
jgi:NAD(P)-dependent dehydrogenase (short-subunit alcohol dehydrogenase family)